ncbi:MAG: glycosyltransferase family 39 protein [Pirellulaceae bacterium]|nr:glycosyltransferase family 39 protein [Pirellulaceae bacterium]
MTDPLPPLSLSKYCLGFSLLSLFIFVVLGIRLQDQVVCGEESRWARGAIEMIATGDWTVPKQQGKVFPERPPMGSWAMGLVGLFRGEVDLLAIRLPSLLATMFTGWLIFFYASHFLPMATALFSALAYMTFGQVLQLGPLGESEALFTLFVSSSILFWHLGIEKKWWPTVTWSIGYTFVTLGALTKGLQAPVYFIVITLTYLTLSNRLRQFFSSGHILGITIFLSLLGMWQIPFYLATNLSATHAIWFGLAGDRVTTHNLFFHMVTYPFEVFGALLPWSPLLLVLLSPHIYNRQATYFRPMLFLILAVAITFPSLWLVAGARGRYFMPLYPLLATLVGCCVQYSLDHVLYSSPSFLQKSWARFIAIVGFLPGITLTLAVFRYLPATPWEILLLAPLCLFVTFLSLRSFVTYQCNYSQMIALFLLPLTIGLTFETFYLNNRQNKTNHIHQELVAVKKLVSPEKPLISLGPVFHRFVYLYEDPIIEKEWPLTAEDKPPSGTIFCYDKKHADTDEVRKDGRGRDWTKVPGTLPFAWEKVMVVVADHRKQKEPSRSVVIGRVK